MKKFTILLTTTVLLIAGTAFSQTKAGRLDTLQHLTLYTCPVHADFVSHEPGKCPTCGKDLTLSPKEKMKASMSKTYVCPIHVSEKSHDPGKCPQCGRKMNLSLKEQMKAEVTKRYTCPMHPEVSLNKDGVCPKCGKELIEKKKAN